MLTKFVLPLFAILLLSSCRKNKTVEYEISGVISDQYTNAGIAGVTVILEVQELSGGNFSTTFKTIESTTTSSNGSYSFKFDRRNASEYRITISKTNYFGAEFSINPDHLNEEAANIKNYDMASKGWVRVNIKNVNPFNASDIVTYQMANTLNCNNGCCGVTPFELEGMNVDTTFICLAHGNSEPTASGFYTKNGTGSSVSETFTVMPLDTVDVNIHY